MPANLYGPNDDYGLEQCDVLQALIRSFHQAKVREEPWVTVRGTGLLRREYLHADDLADACLFLMNRYEESEIVNIGVGKDVSVAELAYEISQMAGYRGDIRFDTSKPDGTPRKLMDVTKLQTLGWSSRIPLTDGLAGTYEWFLQHYAQVANEKVMR